MQKHERKAKKILKRVGLKVIRFHKATLTALFSRGAAAAPRHPG